MAAERLLPLADLSPHPLRQCFLIQFTGCDPASGLFKLLWSHRGINIVETKECQAGHHCSAFVPIDEGMVLGDVEEIGRSHRGEILM